MAIEPEFRRLALSDENGIQTFDFDTGEMLASIPLSGVVDLLWVGEERLLVAMQGGVWRRWGFSPKT